MYHINEVRPDRGVRVKIAEAIPLINKHGAEMSMFDSAFLCGLLEQHRPRKILEVGVSAGGTTAVVLQCLHDMGYDFEMYSVDLSRKASRFPDQEAGFLAAEAKALLGIESHRLYAGTILPDCIEEIGGDIDFLILDTVHRLPGEVLDFLTALPWLRDGAIVCLHDIRFQFSSPGKRTSIATSAILSSVSGEKYLNEDNRRSHGYPNIGAFQISPETVSRAADVAGTLLFRWGYLPEKQMLDSYLRVIESHYGEDVVWILRHACDLNRDAFGVADRLRNSRPVKAAADIVRRIRGWS